MLPRQHLIHREDDPLTALLDAVRDAALDPHLPLQLAPGMTREAIDLARGARRARGTGAQHPIRREPEGACPGTRQKPDNDERDIIARRDPMQREKPVRRRDPAEWPPLSAWRNDHVTGTGPAGAWAAEDRAGGPGLCQIPRRGTAADRGKNGSSDRLRQFGIADIRIRLRT